LSLILALRVHRAANPNVEIHWDYSGQGRKLVVIILNTGRAEVTIASVDLYIERHVITSRSWIDNAFAMRIDKISHIPAKLWIRNRKTLTLPTRLASHSALTVQVRNDAISLPSQYPLDELTLKFVVRFPARTPRHPWAIIAPPFGGAATAYFGHDVLRHFAGINPDVPVTYPSPGSLPMED
jgi:hypothetical protein